jgi:hypothetical protein
VASPKAQPSSLFVWLVADGWCWFVLREKYCWLIACGWFILREKYCWLVADKPSEQGNRISPKPTDVSFASTAPTHHQRVVCCLPVSAA